MRVWAAGLLAALGLGTMANSIAGCVGSTGGKMATREERLGQTAPPEPDEDRMPRRLGGKVVESRDVVPNPTRE